MNTTGIVRQIDALGRIVVPRETRQSLCIEAGDPIEIFYDEKTIYLKKYDHSKCREALTDTNIR